jgi:hypothetical protein
MYGTNLNTLSEFWNRARFCGFMEQPDAFQIASIIIKPGKMRDDTEKRQAVYYTAGFLSLSYPLDQRFGEDLV